MSSFFVDWAHPCEAADEEESDAGLFTDSDLDDSQAISKC